MGVGGSGKQSLCRLAAFISGFAVVQIVISSTYGISDLKEDLKSMYVTAGLREEGVVLLLTDSQITDERFLIYINDLLASGNIPDLYTPEEVCAVPYVYVCLQLVTLHSTIHTHLPSYLYVSSSNSIHIISTALN